jgi:ABC-type multidrug transport system fused ATPase/permease subunit
MVFFTLFYYSPLLAVFALLVAPVAAVASWWLGRKLKRLQVKVQESEASYRSFLQESLANLLIVKAFANEDYSTEKLTQLREERFFWVFKRTKMGLISSTAMSLSFQVGYIAAFAYGALQISRHMITYGTMSVFLTLVNQVQAPVVQLAQQIPKVVSILASAGRVIELQNIPLEEKLSEQITAQGIGVEISNLTFGYTEETVLEEVSLDIHPGEFVAIIGESGIGKTTLIRIIMSFMSNIQGQVSFYNEAGETEKANAGTREFIAYVPQGNTLFSGTVRENIRMGNLNATEEELLEALKLASGYEFVMGLPKGLDTVIGERGHGLSEGQAQRIAIARAFVRKAPFLILDEATSALDEATELSVLRGLKRLEPKPTCLIITHRKSILQYCDREIKIDHKKTMEV